MGEAVPYYNPEFFQTNQLTVRNLIMGYFRYSPFFSDCLNLQYPDSQDNSYFSTDGISFRIERIQQRDKESYSGPLLYKSEIQDLVICPGLAIINKVFHIDQQDYVVEKYYVINGKIYLAQTLDKIISEKLCSTIYHIQEAMKGVYNMFKWTEEKGYVKKEATDETETSYNFKTSELKSFSTDILDTSKLRDKLLDSLLTEIGIPPQPQ